MARKIIGNLKFQKPQDDGFDANQFAKMIEEAYLAETGKSQSWKKKNSFSPSTIGYGYGNCPRYWFIAFNGAEFQDQFDAMARANMDNGSDSHDRIQKVMGKTTVFKDKEVEVKFDSPPIRGFVDVIIEWNNKEVIGEIKTAKDEVYLIRQSEMQPTANHLIQILIYMKIRNADQGFLYYENKNDQTYLIIPVNMNDKNKKLINDIFEWMNKVHINWKDQVLPTRSFTKSSYSCKSCPVAKTCWKEMDDGDIEIEALAVK